MLMSCSRNNRHQRNIVDDVLSYSKLDSSMLALAPKPCEPIREVGNSLKMFQPEMRKQGIQFEYCVDQCYHDIAIEWVMADLARVGQVLVNLVSLLVENKRSFLHRATLPQYVQSSGSLNSILLSRTLSLTLQ